MKLTKETAENIMNMLLSSDEDNAFMAFKAIEAHKFTSSTVGYLVYFYKFSKYTADDWKMYAPKAYKKLDNLLDLSSMLTYAKGISFLISSKSEEGVIELFLERHVKELAGMLESMGYPVDHLDIQLKLKSR